MAPYPSVEVALNALQARNDVLERLVEERSAELAAAQRTATLEGALDRVRTQAMRIRHSDETLGIAVAVFDALLELGLPVLQVGLSGPPDAATGEAAVWVAGVDAEGAPRASHYVSATTGHPALDAAYRAEAPDVRALDPAAFEAYLRASLVRYPPSYADRAVARTPPAPAYHVAAVPAGSPQSGPLSAVLSRAPADQALSVLGRFAALFGLALTRYQGLQHAEAQARRSQIDAALERVRARALAMRRSDDLGDVVASIFDELSGLGVPAHRSAVAVVDGPESAAAYWSSEAGAEPVSGTATLVGHPFYDALLAAWRRSSDLSYILEGDELGAYLERRGPAADGRTREYVHAVSAPSGVLVAFADRPFSEDTVQVMQRLADAFEFAHTRHQDLERAEERARAAAQTASVDRVRAEIASMRTAGDLDRITPLIWEELTGLGVPLARCGVLIVDEGGDAVRAFLATPGGAPVGSVTLPPDGHPLLGRVVDAWRRQATLAETWTRDQAEAWTRMLEGHGLDRPPTAPPAPLALHFAPFAQGMLYVGAAAPLPAPDAGAVQALADAFEVAYARYDDFQRLEARKQEVEAALAELRAAQQQLVQSEKLASLGALTAGIAHEIKNPLNFVNNFAALSRELAADLAAELEGDADLEVVRELLADLESNAERIEAHGRRADSIVRGMMQHARGGEGRREPVDLNALVEEHLSLAYHGRRAQVPDFNVTLERGYAADAGQVEAVSQEIGRVLINLVNNAFDAVTDRAAAEDPAFAPTVRVSTARVPGAVEVRVADNGPGMPEDVRARVFDPFFTTKPTGQGTGLGLSMSHDIVELGHGGRLWVEGPGEGATFVVSLPA